MEQSPWWNPAFLVSSVGLVIGAIVWLARLEFRTNANSVRILELEKIATIAAVQIEADMKENRQKFYEHAANVKLHQNEAAEIEFRTNLERRFTSFEKSLEDIGRKLNHMGGRE